MENRENLRNRLAAHNLTFVWLINILRSRGMKVDKSEMSSAVNGTIAGKKAATIIETSHFILDEYEKFIRSVTV